MFHVEQFLLIPHSSPLFADFSLEPSVCREELFMPASTVRVQVTNQETVIPDGVFIYSRTDLKGRITEANPAFAQISGYPVEAMLGKPHNLVRHPDMPREAFADLWSNLQKGRPWQGVVKNRRSDGGFYWVLANASPVRENGQIVGYQSIRFKPSREQIRGAEEAYRRIREGDRSLAIVDGRAVSPRARRWEVALGWTTQLRLGMILALVAAITGSAALLTGTAYPLLRPFALSAFGLSALAALSGFFFVDRRIHREMNATVDYLETVLTSGNLKTQFDLGRDDGLGPIARRLSLFIGWVEATVLSISDAVGAVQTGTEDVLKGVLEIEKAAQSQSAASASVAAAAAELDFTIREVSGHLQTTETTVGETGRQATAGAGVSERAAAQIQDLAQAIHNAASEVEALGATSAEVGQIAGVIREIADQTNLLALNASIEAARAGAAGRGFAVVATEVRNLADRTMKATGNIDSLIVKIKGDSDRAIGGMRHGAAQVADGVTLVQNARDTLNGINALMSEAVRRVSEIANSSTQQTEAMNEITRNITQVAAMTEQNEATVRRTTQQMQVLAPLVDRVQRAILQYRV
jgi:aerotaxis receptor